PRSTPPWASTPPPPSTSNAGRSMRPKMAKEWQSANYSRDTTHLLNCRLLHLQQLHQEMQRRIRRNIAASSASAVTQIRRNPQLDHAAFAHQLHPFRPAGNDLIEAKRNRLFPLIRAVEHLAVIQPAVV